MARVPIIAGNWKVIIRAESTVPPPIALLSASRASHQHANCSYSNQCALSSYGRTAMNATANCNHFRGLLCMGKQVNRLLMIIIWVGTEDLITLSERQVFPVTCTSRKGETNSNGESSTSVPYAITPIGNYAFGPIPQVVFAKYHCVPEPSAVNVPATCSDNEWCTVNTRAILSVVSDISSALCSL